MTIAVYDVHHSALSASLEMADDEYVYEQVGQDYLSEGEDAADVRSSTNRADNVYTDILMDMAIKEEAVAQKGGEGKETMYKGNRWKGATAPGIGKSVLVLRDEAPFKVCISRSLLSHLPWITSLTLTTYACVLCLSACEGVSSECTNVAQSVERLLDHAQWRLERTFPWSLPHQSRCPSFLQSVLKLFSLLSLAHCKNMSKAALASFTSNPFDFLFHVCAKSDHTV